MGAQPGCEPVDGRGQRPTSTRAVPSNRGADFCTGSHGDRFVHAFKWFEAPWCCSMRGAEGLSCAARYAAFTDPAASRDIWFPFYFEGAVTVRAPGGELGKACLKSAAAWPAFGACSAQVTNVDKARRSTTNTPFG